jgi:inositol oxygenase
VVELDRVSDDVDVVNILKDTRRYDEASTFDAEKDKLSFRRYEEACDRVKGLYAVRSPFSFPVRVYSCAVIQEQHRKQTLEYNIRIREHFGTTVRARLSIWAALEKLDALVDASGPDTSIGQLEHLLQTDTLHDGRQVPAASRRTSCSSRLPVWSPIPACT